MMCDAFQLSSRGRHVASHDPAVPTQVAAPEIRTQRIPRKRLVARMAHQVARASDQPRARPREICRSERMRVVEGRRVIQSHYPHVILTSLTLAILRNQGQHVHDTRHGRVARAIPDHPLCHVDLLLLAGVFPVGLRDNEDLHGVHLRNNHESSHAQPSRFINELLGTEIKARCAELPDKCSEGAP